MPNPDHSDLDKKYFIDHTVYNCPYCNRNNVPYEFLRVCRFDWSKTKECYAFFISCKYCKNTSMHLSYERIFDQYQNPDFLDGIDIDSSIFYSVPTSFFTIDSRIPKPIRAAVTEAEGCVKMNYLTGASACARKAIYELLVKENAAGDDYTAKIKSLKEKFPNCEPGFFDTIGQIQGMTSDMVHEQSWPKWDSKYLKLIIETIKVILYEIYVLPDEKADRIKAIERLHQDVKVASKAKRNTSDTNSATLNGSQ